MNRFTKLAALGIATASMILMSCGSDGKDGHGGAAGAKCFPQAAADGSGVDVVCGETVVGTLPNGTRGGDGQDGPQGDAGPRCEVSIGREGKKEVYYFTCGNVTGKLEGPNMATPGCELVTTTTGDSTMLSIDCGDERFVFTLCDGSTYDGSLMFCYNDELVNRCGGEMFNPNPTEEGVLPQECARNLVIGLEREVGLTYDDEGHQTGISVSAKYFDVGEKATLASSSNWKVVNAGECFYSKGGMPVVKDCDAFGASGAISEYFETCGGSNCAKGDTMEIKIKSGLFGVKACGQDQFFDLATEQCVSAGDSESPCTSVLKADNTCYTDGRPVSEDIAFVNKCVIDTKNLWFDPKTVASCDESRKVAELAIECVSPRYFSSVLFENGMTGEGINSRIACVISERPSVCPGGVEPGEDGICRIAAADKIAVCPAGWRQGSEGEGGTKYCVGDVGCSDEARWYCVKEPTDDLCPDGAKIITSGEDKGLCQLTSSAIAAAPSNWTLGTGDNLGSYLFQLKANNSASSALVCGTGYTFDGANCVTSWAMANPEPPTGTGHAWTAVYPEKGGAKGNLPYFYYDPSKYLTNACHAGAQLINPSVGCMYGSIPAQSGRIKVDAYGACAQVAENLGTGSVPNEYGTYKDAVKDSVAAVSTAKITALNGAWSSAYKADSAATVVATARAAALGAAQTIADDTTDKACKDAAGTTDETCDCGDNAGNTAPSGAGNVACTFTGGTPNAAHITQTACKNLAAACVASKNANNAATAAAAKKDADSTALKNALDALFTYACADSTGAAAVLMPDAVKDFFGTAAESFEPAYPIENYAKANLICARASTAIGAQIASARKHNDVSKAMGAALTELYKVAEFYNASASSATTSDPAELFDDAGVNYVSAGTCLLKNGATTLADEVQPDCYKGARFYTTKQANADSVACSVSSGDGVAAYADADDQAVNIGKTGPKEKIPAGACPGTTGTASPEVAAVASGKNVGAPDLAGKCGIVLKSTADPDRYAAGLAYCKNGGTYVQESGEWINLPGLNSNNMRDGTGTDPTAATACNNETLFCGDVGDVASTTTGNATVSLIVANGSVNKSSGSSAAWTFPDGKVISGVCVTVKGSDPNWACRFPAAADSFATAGVSKATLPSGSSTALYCKATIDDGDNSSVSLQSYACPSEGKSYQLDGNKCVLDTDIPNCRKLDTASLASNWLSLIPRWSQAQWGSIGTFERTDKAAAAISFRKDFKVCAIAIDDGFCPVNSKATAATPASSLVSEFFWEEYNCKFKDGMDEAKCPTGFVLTAQGWCEG